MIIGPILGGWVAESFGETATVGVSALLLFGIMLFYWIRPVRYQAGQMLERYGQEH